MRQIETGSRQYCTNLQEALLKLSQDPTDIKSAILAAQIYAKFGMPHKGILTLEPILTNRPTEEDAWGALGRCYKDLFKSTGNEEYGTKAILAYQEGSELTGSSYCLINCASISKVLNKDPRPFLEKLESSHSFETHDYWHWMTLAEAHLLRNNLQEMITCLQKGLSFQNTPEMQVSSWKQFHWLSKFLEVDLQTIKDLFSHINILVYSGHAPDRPNQNRFNLDKPKELRARIKQCLNDLQIGFAFGSCSAGADLFFIEEAIARGCETQIVLPFKQEEFLSKSVLAYGKEWEKRFHSAVENCTSIHFSRERESSGLDHDFDFCNAMISGLATHKAEEVSSESSLCLVWDGNLGSEGGTGSFYNGYGGFFKNIKRIDPINFEVFDLEPNEVKPTVDPSIKGILLADTKGFSQLTESHAKCYIEGFYNLVSRRLSHLKDCNINTWGDAFIIFSDSPWDLALACHPILEDLEKWKDNQGEWAHGIELRMVLHTSPLTSVKDHLLNKTIPFSQSLSTISRMEPITPPGVCYASEQAIAILSLKDIPLQGHYAGDIPLAKNYGTVPMYALLEKK